MQPVARIEIVLLPDGNVQARTSAEVATTMYMLGKAGADLATLFKQKEADKPQIVLAQQIPKVA